MKSAVILSCAVLAACSSSTTPSDGGSTSGGPTGTALTLGYDAGFNATTSTPNTIGVTFSGETLGIAGLPFNPTTAGDPYFVDGWNMTFTKYLYVADNIRLNTTPLVSSTVWPQMGPQVASKKGPFVLNAHLAAGFVGKDGVEPASGLFLWTALDDGHSFDNSVRYGFSYDVVKASYPAYNVNLTQDEFASYDLMVKNGWSKYIEGVATYVGTGTYTNPSDPKAAAAQANFAKLPTTIYFAFGWNDATSMENCVNYDWTNSEDNLNDRGIQTSPDKTYIAQITMHTDHVFWDKVRQEGANLRFDPIAAYAPASTSAATPWFINDSPQTLAATFSDGTPLPDRAPYQPNASANANPVGSDGTGDGTQVVLNTNGTTGLPNSLPAFMAFSAQSQSHLNAQGLCYIVGQNAGDPYYSPTIQQVSQ